MSKTLSGVLPIVHTPFLADDTVDMASLRRQIDWASVTGAHGLAVGMVSELLRLTHRERLELTTAIVQYNAGRGVVVAGVGAESTKQAVEYARAAAAAGCDAMMAIPPVSTALPADQLLKYFTTLAEAVELPLIVQDASGYVGRPIPLDVCVELLDRFGADRVLFKPESNPVGPRLSALREITGGRARIFDGSGGLSLVDCYRRGIVGTMPGMEYLPGIIALWNALQRGDERAIYRLYLPICALVNLQLQAGLDGFLAVEKHILAQRGLFTTPARREPYAWEMDPETQQELERLLNQLEAALAETQHDAQT